MAEDFVRRRGWKRGVSIRHSHPTLFHSIMTISLSQVALAVNFWTSNPTFNPYGIPKTLIGVIFCLLGINQLIFLNVFRAYRKVRFGFTLSAAFMMFWGVSNTQQSFAGKASFQLPVLLVTIAILHIPLLIELHWLEQ